MKVATAIFLGTAAAAAAANPVPIASAATTTVVTEHDIPRKLQSSAVRVFDSTSWSGNLISATDFGSNNSDNLPMVVVLNDIAADYYVGFSGVHVTVTKFQNGQTSLEGMLNEVGQSKMLSNWNDTGMDLVVEVKEIVDSDGMSYAGVDIAIVEPVTENPTRSPVTPSPSSRKATTKSPVGVYDWDNLELSMSMASDPVVTPEPTTDLTPEPTPAPTLEPTTAMPSNSPSVKPTSAPTDEPTKSPTHKPTKPLVCTAKAPADRIGEGYCLSEIWSYYDYLYTGGASTATDCEVYCRSMPNFETSVVGFEVGAGYGCTCLFDNGQGPEVTDELLWEFDIADYSYGEDGTGPIFLAYGEEDVHCHVFVEQIVPCSEA